MTIVTIADRASAMRGNGPAQPEGEQAWIRRQPVEPIGLALHDSFVESYAQGTVITSEESAKSLLVRLPSEATAGIWSVRGA